MLAGGTAHGEHFAVPVFVLGLGGELDGQILIGSQAEIGNWLSGHKRQTGAYRPCQPQCRGLDAAGRVFANGHLVRQTDAKTG